MTVTFTPTTGTDATLFSYGTSPTGWTLPGSGSESTATQLVFTYTSGFGNGSSAPIANGSYFGTYDSTQRGTFNLLFAAAGYTAATYGFTTPSPRAGAVAGSPGERRPRA